MGISNVVAERLLRTLLVLSYYTFCYCLSLDIAVPANEFSLHHLTIIHGLYMESVSVAYVGHGILNFIPLRKTHFSWHFVVLSG